MITYNKLAEQIILQLSGGDPSRDSQLEMEDVVLLVRQAITEVVKMQVFSESNTEGTLDSEFHYVQTRRDIAVVWDRATMECYSIIPLVPMSIPGNKGLKEVAPNKRSSNEGNAYRPFMPIKPGQIGMIEDIIEQGEVVYWPEKNKVYFHKNITGDHTKVSMKIVVPAPDDLGSDADFFLPDDIQSMVIQRVKELMSPQAPQDKINNSNKDI